MLHSEYEKDSQLPSQEPSPSWQENLKKKDRYKIKIWPLERAFPDGGKVLKRRNQFSDRPKPSEESPPTKN